MICLKKYFFVFLVMLLFFNSCNKKLSHVDKKSKKDSLAFELCQIYGLDQGIRNSKSFPGKMKLIQRLDTLNFERILRYVEVNGIPNEKTLGKKNISNECVAAAMTSVLLHSPHLLVNNPNYLKVFIYEIEKGNLDAEYLATILDKYYWVRKDEFGNRKVLYGTQFGKPCRMYRKQSDSVRAIIGLKPLADSLFIDCKKIKK